MKRSILIYVCCLLATGLCLGQSDSVKTARDSITVTVATEKTANDSVIVVKIHAADLAKKAVEEIAIKGEQPAPVPEFCLGVRFFSLYDFPGTVFFQKKIPCNAFVGAGINYKRGQYDSQGEYGRIYVTNKDTIATKGSAWTATISAELTIPVKQYKGWHGSATISTLFSYGKSDSTVRYTYPATSYYFTDMEVLSERHEVGFGLDLTLERDFAIFRQPFTIGIINPLMYLSKSKEVVKTTYHYSEGDPRQETYQVDIDRPWQIGMNNPLSGRIGLQIKYLFY